MGESLFITWVQQFFRGVVLRLTETLNGTKQNPTYLFTRMLRKAFSLNGKWDALSVFNTRVAADVVAMDSELPLKKRDSISKASGDIPKMGMELKLNENELTQIDTLAALDGNDAEIQRRLFQDTVRCITGIYERLEGMFLQGLSTGVTVVDDGINTGTGVRLDFGYLPANKFGVSVLWSNPATAKPLDDIQRLIDKSIADGNVITRIMLDQNTFKAMSLTDQIKQYYGFMVGFAGDKTIIAVPDQAQVSTLLNSRYGITMEIVKRSVRYEKNGVQTAVNPWQAGMIVFLCQDQVGSLVYAALAERNHPVEGVTYVLAEDYILASKYRNNKPALSEYTSSQARVCPVISDVNQIYQLDTTTIQA